MRQKVRLPATLASLNSGHSFDLCACCVGVRSSSRPSLVPAKPLCTHSTVWRSSLIVNLSNTTLGHAPIVRPEVHAVTSHYHVVVTTLARSLMWSYNNFMLSRCTNSFSVSPSLASKPMRRNLNLCSSCMGVSVRVSIAQLTT